MRKILLAVLTAFSVPASALDGVSAEIGRGVHDVHLWRLGLQWNVEPEFLEGSRWNLYWDLSVGGWHGDRGTVHDAGLTPVFRYSYPNHRVFYEAAIGFHVLSDSHINSDLGFSTRFQFGDHLAVGYRFNDRYDVSLRLQHLSNGGMRNPNPGINFVQVRAQYWLR